MTAGRRRDRPARCTCKCFERSRAAATLLSASRGAGPASPVVEAVARCSAELKTNASVAAPSRHDPVRANARVGAGGQMSREIVLSGRPSAGGGPVRMRLGLHGDHSEVQCWEGFVGTAVVAELDVSRVGSSHDQGLKVSPESVSSTQPMSSSPG